MLAPRAFWFLRHGETDWNARGLSQGNVDIPLNDVGRAQARTAAGLLRTRGIRSIVASPLSRAHDTALIAAELIGQPVEVQDDLREVEFGVQEGQPMADWFDDWVAGHTTPEGPDAAETIAFVLDPDLRRAVDDLALRTRTEAALNTDPPEAARVARLLLETEPYDVGVLALVLEALRACGNHRSLRRHEGP